MTVIQQTASEITRKRESKGQSRPKKRAKINDNNPDESSDEDGPAEEQTITV